MPRISEKQQIVKEIDQILLLLIIDDNPRNQHEIDELLELKAHILSFRYFSSSNSIPKSLEHRTMLLILPGDEFREAFRMNKDTFIFILNKIQNHQVFKNNSRHQQQPVWLQLLVALERFGFDGTSSSVGKISRNLGISRGTVILYTARIIEAILSIHDEFIKWPNRRRKKQTSDYFEENHQFKGLIGIVDGTFINLCEKPQVDPETYWSRKQRYSMNVQIVCNERREIIYYQVGYPGSCPDTVCFRNCDVFKNPERYFSNGEYLLADGGYVLNNRTLVPYRNPQEPEKLEFNRKLSSARIIVEHVMGILKGRWGSLRGLRLKIKEKQDTENVNKWIVCCLILHNIVTGFNDNWTVEVVDADFEFAEEEQIEEDGNEFRERIRESLF